MDSMGFEITRSFADRQVIPKKLGDDPPAALEYQIDAVFLRSRQFSGENLQFAENRFPLILSFGGEGQNCESDLFKSMRNVWKN